MGKNERKVVELDDYEYRVMIEALADRRHDLIEENREPEDVSDLLLKVIDAPVIVRGRKSAARDSR